MSTEPPRPAATFNRLILASASPRRAALLRERGYVFTVVPPPLHEPADLGIGVTPAQRAEALSFFKARSAAPLVEHGWILAGDTIAVVGEEVLGKPADRAEAGNILRALSGTTHQVITGVTLLDAESGARVIRHDSTAVTMRPLTTQDIERYLDTGAWEGKAGAYGIQDHGDAFVERICGSFTNVVGLPMELVSDMLAEWGGVPLLLSSATRRPVT